jgi:hypothetical protein
MVYKHKTRLVINRTGFFVPPHGFEPRSSDPETDMLPLHHRGVNAAAMIKNFFKMLKLG